MQKFLTKEFYVEAHEKYGCFPKSLELLCQAVEEIAADEARKELLLTLIAHLQAEKHYDGEPELSDKMDMLPALAICACVPEMIEMLVKCGFSRETAEKTAREIDAEIVEPLRDNTGDPGLTPFLVKWFCKYLRGEIVRIGRFNFERCEAFRGKIRVYKNQKGEKVTLIWNLSINAEGGATQKDEEEAYFAEGKEEDGLIMGHKVLEDGLVDTAVTVLEAKDWRLVLQEGDPVIGIHIPAAENFSQDYVNQSYAEGVAMLRECWKDLCPKALTCKSWMMDPGLKELLPERSNILAFQNAYTPFTSRANAKAALNCVFGYAPEDYSVLPENTSLQRAMKDYYLAGKRIRHHYAYWLLEDTDF